MNRCLICFEQIEKTLNNNYICNRCFAKFKVIEKKVYYRGIEIFILYEYNDFFKELLYRFKGCYDIALKDAFLNNFLVKLKRMYRGRKIIPAPSFIEDDKNRGFNHVIEIANNLNLDIIDCLVKTKKYKQSDQKIINRSVIQKYIRIDNTMIKDKDRILIFDDVATSLSTIKTIIHLLPTNIDKKVLILASNCRFMENGNN